MRPRAAPRARVAISSTAVRPPLCRNCHPAAAGPGRAPRKEAIPTCPAVGAVANAALPGAHRAREDRDALLPRRLATWWQQQAQMADASRGSPGARRIGGTLELSFKEIASVQGIVKAVAELQLASGEVEPPTDDQVALARSAGAHEGTPAASAPPAGGASVDTAAGPSMHALGLPEPKRRRFQAVKLDNNAIESLAGLGPVLARVVSDPAGVKLLDLSFNRLSVGMASDIAAAGCEGLLKLYLHGNAVESLGEVVALAETCPSLRALSLHGCPVREHPAYRPFLVATFPNLVTLDFTPVTPAERDAAVSWRKMTKVKVPPVAPPPS